MVGLTCREVSPWTPAGLIADPADASLLCPQPPAPGVPRPTVLRLPVRDRCALGTAGQLSGFAVQAAGAAGRSSASSPGVARADSEGSWPPLPESAVHVLVEETGLSVRIQVSWGRLGEPSSACPLCDPQVIRDSICPALPPTLGLTQGTGQDLSILRDTWPLSRVFSELPSSQLEADCCALPRGGKCLILSACVLTENSLG